MSVNLHQTLYRTADVLNIHTRAIEITGQNIANVNNEAYAARKVRISASPTMAIAHGRKGGNTGVLDISVVTEREALVDRQIMQTYFRTGKLERETENNALLENLLGESFQLNAQGAVELGDDFATKGLSYDLRGFFNACSALSADPISSPEKMNVISHGQSLVDRIVYLKNRFTEMDEYLTLRMEEEVEDINTLLEEIALQTQKINDFEKPYRNEKAFELRESRQANLEKLSRLMKIDVTETPSAFQISSDNIELLSGKKVRGKLSFDGINFKFGNDNIAIKQGRLGGEFSTKFERIPEMKLALSTWIEDFTTLINAAYDTNRDGAKLFDGNDLDTFTFVANFDTLKTSSSDLSPGANDRIRAVVAVQNEKIHNGTLEENYRKFVVNTAQNFKSTTDSLESELLVQKMLLQQRENRIGVSIDSELVDLIRSQKAFQAAAKVITLVDELLETAINLVRR